MDAYTMPISGDAMGGAVPGFGGESKGIVSRLLDAPKPLVKAAAKGYLFVGEKLAGIALSAGAPEKVGMAVHYWWGLAVLLLVVVLYGMASLIALPARIVTYPMRLISGGEGFDPYGDALLKKFNAKAGAYSSDGFFSAPDVAEGFFTASDVAAEAQSGFFAEPDVRSGFFAAPDVAAEAARARSEKMVINPMIECLGLTDAQCRARLAGDTMTNPRISELVSPGSGYATGAESMSNPRVDSLMPGKMSNPRIDALLPPPAENYSPKPRAWKKKRFASSAYATQAARNEKYTNYVSSAQPAFGSTLLTGTRNQGDAAATGAEAEAFALKTLGAI